jgi:hypothetical protein
MREKRKTCVPKDGDRNDAEDRDGDVDRHRVWGPRTFRQPKSKPHTEQGTNSLTAIQYQCLDDCPSDLGSSKPSHDPPQQSRPTDSVRVDQSSSEGDLADVLGSRGTGKIGRYGSREGGEHVEGEGEGREGPERACGW